MPYVFGQDARAGVEIPELDEFLSDLNSVFERHGACLAVRTGEYEGDSPYLVLEPASAWSDSAVTDNIREADVRIPWVAVARADYAVKEAAANAERLRKQREATVRCEQNQVQAQIAAEARLKAEGLQLSDGTYKLVKV